MPNLGTNLPCPSPRLPSQDVGNANVSSARVPKILHTMLRTVHARVDLRRQVKAMEGKINDLASRKRDVTVILNLKSRKRDVAVTLIMKRKIVDQLLKSTVPLIRFSMIWTRSMLVRLTTRVSVGPKLLADTRNNLRSKAMMKAKFYQKKLQTKRAKPTVPRKIKLGTTHLPAVWRRNTKVVMKIPGLAVSVGRHILTQSKYFGSNVRVVMLGTMLHENALVLMQGPQKNRRSGAAGLVIRPWLGWVCSLWIKLL
mmetsp:Transcript_15784/g.28643  ORF Transcript_15784/g.28643 Transcript_15784/m.28643 type:complete len:255 (+) Transcript_15784:3533-4297(+)